MSHAVLLSTPHALKLQEQPAGDGTEPAADVAAVRPGLIAVRWKPGAEQWREGREGPTLSAWSPVCAGMGPSIFLGAPARVPQSGRDLADLLGSPWALDHEAEDTQPHPGLDCLKGAVTSACVSRS